MEKEGVFTFITLSAGQSVVGPINGTIFESDDVVLYINEQLCAYDATPTALLEYKLAFTPGVQGFTVTLGGNAVGGERLTVQRKLDAFRLAQFPLVGALPIEGLNDEQNALVAMIQSAHGWDEIRRSFFRVRPYQNLGPELSNSNGAGLVGVDDEGRQRLYTFAEVAQLIGDVSMTPEALVALLMQVLIGIDIDITDNGDGTITLDADLGGDCLLLEGDQQTGVGGGGSVAPLTLEDIADYLGTTLFQNGTDFNFVYNDAANTITLNATGGSGGLTAEQVMDQVAAMLAESSPLQAVYNDGADTYTLSIDQNALKPPSAWLTEVVAYETALTTGAKKQLRVPFGMTLTGVRAGLTTAQTGGGKVTVDVKLNGVTIFGANKLTVDNGSKTSVGAAVPADITTTVFADDSSLTYEISGVGDGTAKGLSVTLLYRRT